MTTNNSNTNLSIPQETQAHLVQLLASLLVGSVRFLATAELWLVWNGVIWDVNQSAVVNMLIDALRYLQQQMPDHAKFLAKFECNRGLADLMELLKHQHQIRMLQGMLDANPYLLNTPGLVVDLRTGNIYQPQPEMLLSKVTRVTCDPNAVCPEFERALARIVPDPAERRFLQHFFGYCLTGDVSEHKVLALLGSGSNGKTLLLNICAILLGSYSSPVPKSLLIKTSNQEHPVHLMTLKGLRLATVSEFDRDWKLDVAMFKSISGGDLLTARHLYRNYETFAPSHKLVIATNRLPAELEGDVAMKRRLLILPFRQQIEESEADKHLAEKLCAAEGPGILRWMVEGCLGWQREGLCIPQSVRDASSKEFEERDVVGTFIKDGLVFGTDQRVTRAILKDRLAEWAELNGFGTVTDGLLGDLYRRVMVAGAIATKVNGIRGFAGVGLAAVGPMPLRVVGIAQ